MIGLRSGTGVSVKDPTEHRSNYISCILQTSLSGRQNTFKLVALRDDTTLDGFVNQPKVLIKQVGNVRLGGVLRVIYQCRLAGPLDVFAPNLLELRYLIVLPSHLEILVYRLPGAVERPDDPTICGGVSKKLCVSCVLMSLTRDGCSEPHPQSADGFSPPGN